MQKLSDFLWLLLEAVFYRLPLYLWQIATDKRPGPLVVAKVSAVAAKERAIAKVEPGLPMWAGFGLALLLPPLMAMLQVIATLIICGIFSRRKVQWWLVCVAMVGAILLTDDAVGKEWTPLLQHIIGWF